ncbi:hypothetical protein ACERK3_08725 [Phycisphaerales bacterium AB-hyl4]|uniref:DUF1795 domain-containing protein n=1 Tax=Natronomicrosphaera hydrolytica TaxID=3242702 RepID=A0ABV4U6D9_9BACT
MAFPTASRTRRRWPLLAVACLCCFAGCEESDIQTYQAPRDPEQPRTTQAQPTDEGQAATDAPRTASPDRDANAATGPDQPADMTWSAPDGWQRSSESQPMRLATYYTGEGDNALEVAVSAFPGEVGGALANINRWREQLGLDPLAEDDWQDHVDAFGEEDGVHGYTLRIDADAEVIGPHGMLAAIIRSPHSQRTHFVRALGQADQLDAHEDDVVAFVHTFQPADDSQHDHAHDHGHDHDHDHAHHDHDHAHRNHDHDHAHAHHDHDHNHAHAHEPSGELHLETPEGWQRTQQTSSIVYATYQVGSGENAAAVAVTPLRGEGGGMLANINMWRSQLGLDPVDNEDEQQAETITIDGREAKLIALDGERELSLVVAILPEDDRTWFFRLSGPRAAVHEHREAFEQLLASARFEEN